MINFLPTSNDEAWPPSYRGYEKFFKRIKCEPMSKAAFEAMGWLTLKHYQTWLFAEIHLEDNQLRLELYSRIDSLTVSKDAQRRVLSDPIDGFDLSDLCFDDNIGVDEFVDFIAQIVTSMHAPLDAA